MKPLVMIGVILALNGLYTAAAQSETDVKGVLACLNDYLDGGTYGDTVKMARAFHFSASMKYIDAKTGEYKDVPIAEFLNRGKARAGQKNERRTRIVSYDIFQTSAQAKVELDGPNYLIYDYFNLLKIDGQWKIVSKIFSRKDE